MKILAVSLAIFLSSKGFGKEVALTIDDAPRGNELIYSGDQRTDRFIEVFAAEKVQAAFFCNSSRLNEANGTRRLEKYAKAGHFIANHTHTHPSLNRTSPETYIDDIKKADGLLNQFTTFKKWFRYPFLKEGKSVDSRDSVRKSLRELNYINGYVTVDNYDYVINDFVQKGLEKKLKVHLEKACQMLSDISLDGLADQEAAAKKMFGREVTQVLLMHENDLEAFCLGNLIRELRKRGWKIVSPEKAFAQPLLSREPETLWLDQGRINAYIAESTGKESKLKWDSMTALNKELDRRKIVEGLTAE